MKKYDTYKESKVPGLDRIPAHWGAERIKYLFSERGELSTTGDEQLLSVSEYYGVAPRTSVMEEGEFVTRAESLVGYKKCFKGDLVSNIMLAWKGSMGVTEHDGIVSPAYSVYVPKEGINPQYFHYLFRTDLFKTLFKIRSRGIIESRLRLYTPDFFDITAIVPPVKEQDAIVEYLSAKEKSIIDSIMHLSSEKNSLIEYRKSVISEAVTKGLQKNIPFIDSRVEWAGMIPQGWTIKRGKSMFSLFSGAPFASDRFTNEKVGMPLIRIRDIQNSKTDTYYTGEYDDAYVIRKGDVLIGMDGDFNISEWKGVDSLLNQRVCKIVNDEKSVLTKFLLYVLPMPLKVINDLTNSTTVKHLSTTDVLAQKLPIPSIEEQRIIVEYLETKTQEIDNAIVAIDSQIKALQDYRKSLIFEAVTGKIDVRK